MLVMFFLNAQPRIFFTGRRLLLFRAMAILPIAYEVACTYLKYRAARGFYIMPAWLFPLLPSKPPMTFVLFIALAVYIKTRERRFCRHGRTHEEYQAFLTTRRNSWNVSVFLAAAIAVVVLIDLLIMMISGGDPERVPAGPCDHPPEGFPGELLRLYSGDYPSGRLRQNHLWIIKTPINRKLLLYLF